MVRAPIWMPGVGSPKLPCDSCQRAAGPGHGAGQGHGAGPARAAGPARSGAGKAGVPGVGAIVVGGLLAVVVIAQRLQVRRETAVSS